MNTIGCVPVSSRASQDTTELSTQMRMEFLGNGTPWSTFKPAHISHYLDLSLLEGIVGVTCGLSMAGSLFIIITFFCFTELRSLGRLLLVHLSAMDFFTACANLSGVFISFHKRMYDDSIDRQGYRIGCLVQGHIAVFATNSSILWTNALALYLLIVLISKRPKVARYSTYIMYLLCYGAPLSINIALAVDDDIGLDNSTAGWCSIKEKTGSNASFYPFFFGNDVWVMASFVFLPAVYIVMKLYLWRVVSVCVCVCVCVRAHVASTFMCGCIQKFKCIHCSY